MNHALIQLHEESGSKGVASVQFPSRVHQSMFLIRVLDFAGEGGDATLTGVKGSCLSVLQAACHSKSFDINQSVSSLHESTTALVDWLDVSTPLALWLPSLDINATLVVPRQEFLLVAGNQAKHNTARLTGVSKRIAAMLTRSGYPTLPEQVPLALEDFQEHLRDDYFVYYGTWLAELLNNVRWGVQRYLLPTFQSSYTRDADGGIAYSYSYPDEIANPIPRQWFWRLMNKIRSGPYLKQFEGSRYAKQILR